jgi:hypothetical protein
MSDEAGTAGAQTDEERARAIREQLKSIHAVDMAYEMMVSLVSFGYQKMGLTAETEELRDMGDARVAIELLRATLGVVEREAGRAETRDLHSTLAQMQLSFARAVQLAGPPQSPAADKPADAPAGEAHATQPPAGEPATGAGDVAPPAEAAGKPKPAAKKPAARKPAQKKRPSGKPGEEAPAG